MPDKRDGLTALVALVFAPLGIVLAGVAVIALAALIWVAGGGTL